MYIKSLVIDGFKSYGSRTVINAFDPEFTAITGLNGSGKSNILDSICFVLGINNLAHVRAESLQDLVYKNGQGGVSRATVTIVFDNTNPSQCPLGYERCNEISVMRQIIVGGKNKYLINGKLVQNKKIVDFFCSVQLNVNNPNFLIMQGRITRVLNMKPQEILSIVEEAAGTSLYESKREATTKLIEKKECRVRETNAVLEEEVQPKLNKLRQERTAYLEWQKMNREIEYLTRIHISFKYLKFKENVKFVEGNIEKLQGRVQICKDTIIKNDEECAKADEKCKDIQDKIDNESGGKLKELEKNLSLKITEDANNVGSLKAAQGIISQDENKLKTIEKEIENDELTLGKKKKELDKVEGLFHSLKAADENDSKEYKDAQRKYDAVIQGLSTNEDGEAATLTDQLRNAKKQLSEAQTTITTSENELRNERRNLKQLETETQANDAVYIKDKQLHDDLENDIKKIEAQLLKINYEDGKFEAMQQRRKELQNEIRNIKYELDRRNSNYDLQYRDPTSNFDRKKVHGMVGKLFSMVDSKHSLALMMTAGGNLYSHVTDDDVTSKMILERGQLQRRVTFIPINKIRSNPIDKSVISFAQNLVGKENADWALNLIDYDPYFDNVMKFVFGRTIICSSIEVAKKVTYHPNIKCRSVSIDGDIVDPEGTLSGGSRPSGANVLEDLAIIKNYEEKLRNCKNELQQVEHALSSLESVAHSYKKLKETLELRRIELETCKGRLAMTSFQQHQNSILTLKESIAALENAIQVAQESRTNAKAKVKDIEAKLSDAEGYRKREKKNALDAMEAARKKAEKSHDNWKKREQEYDTLKLEIEELQKGIESAMKQREEIVANIVKQKADLEQLRTEVASSSDEIAEIKRLIKKQKEEINSKNREVVSLLNKKEKLCREVQEFTLEIKKKENEIVKVRGESDESLKKIETLEQNYKWILEDRDCFGIKNTRYDYTKEDPVAAGRKVLKLQEQKAKMERSLNMNAMALLEREEETYQETIRRKKIVEQDKVKIEGIIVKMDEKKREQVETAWKLVNENFSSIFSTLLHGAQACLSPVIEKNQLLGLEIKVGFNGVWKDSLGELSGGQRSLVALSLILAMLKFSPAPLYILDEVDAALDMSHTQNIGNMLKQHFTNSQFIIVSLKDGMFNNANVLFRTKFEDGVSTVTRTVSTKNTKRVVG